MKQSDSRFNLGKQKGHLSLLPFIVSSRQWWARGRFVANFILLLQHAVGEGDEVALQDHQALPQTLGRQGTFGQKT